MATNKSKNKEKSSRKKNNKNIISLLLPISILAIIIYILYKIISLIVVPTEMFMIKNDAISKEESVVRICDKR